PPAHPPPPPFPYTTLFRSTRPPRRAKTRGPRRDRAPRERRAAAERPVCDRAAWRAPTAAPLGRERAQHPETRRRRQERAAPAWRSEEHTSELQSRSDLVCR